MRRLRGDYVKASLNKRCLLPQSKNEMFFFSFRLISFLSISFDEEISVMICIEEKCIDFCAMNLNEFE